MAKDSKRKCPDCSYDLSIYAVLDKGDGRCRHCDGTGEVDNPIVELFTLGTQKGDTTCKICSGTGQCQTCGGTGYEYYYDDKSNKSSYKSPETHNDHEEKRYEGSSPYYKTNDYASTPSSTVSSSTTSGTGKEGCFGVLILIGVFFAVLMMCESEDSPQSIQPRVEHSPQPHRYEQPPPKPALKPADSKPKIDEAVTIPITLPVNSNKLSHELQFLISTKISQENIGRVFDLYLENFSAKKNHYLKQVNEFERKKLYDKWRAEFLMEYDKISPFTTTYFYDTEVFISPYDFEDKSFSVSLPIPKLIFSEKERYLDCLHYLCLYKTNFNQFNKIRVDKFEAEKIVNKIEEINRSTGTMGRSVFRRIYFTIDGNNFERMNFNTIGISVRVQKVEYIPSNSNIVVYTQNVNKQYDQKESQVSYDNSQNLQKNYSNDSFSLFGQWRGGWWGNGYYYLCVVDLKRDASDKVLGQIEWKLLDSPANNDKNKLGLTAIEFVEGFFEKGTGELKINGVRKQDSYNLISLDSYRLRLSDDILWLDGVTRTSGTWQGNLSAINTRNMEYSTDIYPFKGKYRLYRLTDRTDRVVGEMELTINQAGDIVAHGKDWQGIGKSFGHFGYYKWKFTNGNTGITNLFIYSAETIQGHVIGKNLDWYYIARMIE